MRLSYCTTLRVCIYPQHQPIPRFVQIVGILQRQTEPGAGAEKAPQPQGHVRRHGAPATHDIVDARGWDADGQRHRPPATQRILLVK